jgi:hypothetical protein
MPGDAPLLSDADLQSIYGTCIRPDVLEGVAKSQSPTAVLVAGTPGADTGYALARVLANLRPSIGDSALIRSADLLAYHPYGRQQSSDGPRSPSGR